MAFWNWSCFFLFSLPFQLFFWCWPGPVSLGSCFCCHPWKGWTVKVQSSYSHSLRRMPGHTGRPARRQTDPHPTPGSPGLRQALLSHWSRYSVVSQAHSVYSSGLSDTSCRKYDSWPWSSQLGFLSLATFGSKRKRFWRKAGAEAELTKKQLQNINTRTDGG